MSEHRCGCFTLHQGSLVASLLLILLYGLTSLAVIIDLSLSITRHDTTFIGCEAATLALLLLQMAAAGFLAHAVTARRAGRLLLWLIWHAVWWLLALVLSSSAVTAAALLTADKTAPAAAGVVLVFVHVLLAYLWSVVFRLHMCAREKGYSGQTDAPA